LQQAIASIIFQFMNDKNLSIRSIRLGALPIIDEYIKKLGVSDLFARHILVDPRDRVPVWKTLGIALRNIILERCPLYKMGEWAQLRGLISHGEADLFNDDRIGRSLDRLYKSDRTAICTDAVLAAIKQYDIKINRVHNDSTSVTLHGQYENYEECGSAMPKHGHNKDHRPDLKQLVFSLSVSSDFAVPLYFKVFDGNITDDTTHIDNWKALRSLVGNSSFVYVADSKLCVRDSMQYIATEGGTFVTVLPETRKEISTFHNWIQTNNPEWTKAIDEPNPRKKDGPRRTYWTYESPVLTAEGYRIIWIKSLHKQLDDAQRRLARIERTEEALCALKKKTHSNEEKLFTEIKALLQNNRTKSYFEYRIIRHVEETTKQMQRGRPTAETPHRIIQKITYQIEYSQIAHSIQSDARYDGIFPLVTNSTEPAPEVLLIYKYQPNLEKRHEQLKSVYNVAPVFLQNPQRIEALLLLYFLAMLVASLIERDVRLKMQEDGVDTVPLYPENRKCKAPTADLIIDIFNDVRLQYICKTDQPVATIPDTLSKRQVIVLKLLKIKPVKFFANG
jgi:transposase